MILEIEMNNQELIDQYKHIEDLRKLHSQHMREWVRIGMPVGGALFGLFSFISIREDGCSLLPLLGWIIFITPMITWRAVAYHIDKQIVDMYPQMLELEKRLKWVANTTYYFNNLSGKAKTRLETELLCVKKNWLKGKHYQQYVEQCRRLSKNPDKPYKLLLDTWNQFGRGSVGSRGHCTLNIAVGVLFLTTLFIMILLT